MATGIAQKAVRLCFHCGPRGKMIYKKIPKKRETQKAEETKKTLEKGVIYV